MAYKKKTASEDNTAFQKLKADLDDGTPGTAYVFYGEETYLREHYLSQLRKLLVPADAEAFNFHRAEGKDLTVQSLTEMAEAMPMLSERTMILVIDWDLFRLPGDQREALAAFLDDVPPWCCVVFLYDTVEWKPNKTMKKLWQAVDRHVECVEFRRQSASELNGWIARRFRALGKEIDRQTAEYLVFTCGELMTGLAQEIDKIASYAPEGRITQRDIDAVADPVLSRRIFDLSDAVTAGDYDRAAVILGDLLKMQTEPVVILGVLGAELRRIYTARLAIDGGKNQAWLEELWGLRPYAAKRLLAAARRTDADWCADAVRQCQTLDRRMKSEAGFDPPGELKLLLVRLASGQAARTGNRRGRT